MKNLILVSAFILVFTCSGRLGFAHCEIPCGIYDDQMRVEMIQEHISTIEKSIKTIEELSNDENKNYNQIVRWVNNKDNHASHIQEIVYQYFMAQRVKPASQDNPKVYAKYVEELKLLHQLLVVAMKTKQTIDLVNVEKARELIGRFSDIYFEKSVKKE